MNCRQVFWKTWPQTKQRSRARWRNVGMQSAITSPRVRNSTMCSRAESKSAQVDQLDESEIRQQLRQARRVDRGNSHRTCAQTSQNNRRRTLREVRSRRHLPVRRHARCCSGVEAFAPEERNVYSSQVSIGRKKNIRLINDCV
jgi:hypothetical protein